MAIRQGGAVEVAGAAYREARSDAFYESVLRLRWQRRRLAGRQDLESQARLRAVVDELHARGTEVT
jgi:hypothetical protein